MSTPEPPTNGTANGDAASEATRLARRRERDARRRNVLIGTAILTALVLVTGATLWLTGVVDTTGSRPTLAARDPAGAPAATSTTVKPRKAPCRSPLTPAAPLRLWIGGDSLAGSLGPSLGNMTAATGVVAPVFDSRVSSGLANPKFFDWPKHASAEMARLDPEVVAFIIGTNDYNVPPATSTAATSTSASSTTQPAVQPAVQPAWKTANAYAVEQMLEILIGPPGSGGAPNGLGRTVYWIGAPILKDAKMDAGAQQINAVARTVIAHHPEVTYIDAHALFAGPDGKFTATLPGLNGKPVRMRAGDGVHLTPDGGDRLAGAVMTPLDARCHVTTQAVAGVHQPVVQTKGSTQIPGTGRSPATGRGSGTVTTPTTAAPVTTPPSTEPPTTEPPTTEPPTTDPPTTAPPN